MIKNNDRKWLLNITIGGKKFAIQLDRSHATGAPVPAPPPCRYFVDDEEVCREAFCAIRDTIVGLLSIPKVN